MFACWQMGPGPRRKCRARCYEPNTIDEIYEFSKKIIFVYKQSDEGSVSRAYSNKTTALAMYDNWAATQIGLFSSSTESPMAINFRSD